MPGLPRWLTGQGARTAVVITACNPFSRPLTDAENALPQERLKQVIELAALRWLPAAGKGRDGLWPGEPSLCVFDPALAQVDEWLNKFEQYAVAVASDDGVSTSVMAALTLEAVGRNANRSVRSWTED